MCRSLGKHPLPLWKLWPSKLAAQSPTQPEIIWKNQTQEKQSKGNTSFNGHINCKDEKCMCKHLVETVKKREPGKMLPEKKYSLEINSRELSTLRYAKCLIDSWFFVCLFFTSLFQILSSSTARVLAQRFSKYKFLYVGSIFAFQSIIVPATRKIM